MTPDPSSRFGSCRLELSATTGAGKNKCIFGDAVLNTDCLPLKCAKLGESTVVALIGGQRLDA